MYGGLSSEGENHGDGGDTDTDKKTEHQEGGAFDYGREHFAGAVTTKSSQPEYKEKEEEESHSYSGATTAAERAHVEACSPPRQVKAQEFQLHAVLAPAERHPERHQNTRKINRLRKKHQKLSHQLMLSLRSNSRNSSTIHKKLESMCAT